MLTPKCDHAAISLGNIVVNSLSHGRCGCDFKCLILKRNLLTDLLKISNGTVLMWMLQDHINDKSTLVQVLPEPKLTQIRLHMIWLHEVLNMILQYKSEPSGFDNTHVGVSEERHCFCRLFSSGVCYLLIQVSSVIQTTGRLRYNTV